MARRRNGKWALYLLLSAAILLLPVAATAGSQSKSKTPAAATAGSSQPHSPTAAAGGDQSETPAWAPKLLNSDCIKCHPKQVEDIESLGGAHRSELTCQDCHQGHPPAVTNNIPQCSECHEGKAHFKLKGCLSCHANPHTPLELTLSQGVTKPCLTCHTKQNAQLQKHKSAHSSLGCTTCHTQHGPPPKCLDCHSPHLKGQTMKDCTSCHKAHMPLQVTYSEDIPSKFCGACHAKQYKHLTSSKTKHAKLACADCHQNRHGVVPKCTDCHGIPHPKGIMAKFSKCGQCHGTAHNLKV